MQTNVKAQTEPKGIRLDKPIIDEIEQVMIEDNRPSFNNTVETLLKEALEARKMKEEASTKP